MSLSTLNFLLAALKLLETLLVTMPSVMTLIQRLTGIIDQVRGGNPDAAPSDEDWAILNALIKADLESLRAHSKPSVI